MQLGLQGNELAAGAAKQLGDTTAEVAEDPALDLGEGANYFLTVRNGFVRRGEKDEVGDVGRDRNIFNGVAMTDVLDNFSAPVIVDCTTTGGPYSFTNFEQVLTDCGGALATIDADVIGTWDEDGSPEGAVFNADHTGGFTDSDVVFETFTWSIENNLIVIRNDGVEIVDVWARTPSGMKFYGESIGNGGDLVLDGNADGSIWVTNYVKRGTVSLTCGYESGWDDTADGGLGAPINPNSFADFEDVIADCGTARSFAASNIEGTVYNNPDGTTTFNNTAASGTSELDPETGVFVDGFDTINFRWYVESATCTGCNYNYLVLFSNDVIEPNLPAGFTFRETRALIGVNGPIGVTGSVYSFANYAEQSNYSDADRATGSDGEIWYADETLQ